MNSNKQYKINLLNDNIPLKTDSLILKKIIGQVAAIKKLIFLVDSCSESTPIPTLLLTGSQGLGKSHTAQKIADALDSDLVEINCGTIENDKDFMNILTGFKKINPNRRKTLLLDESHKLTSQITTILLTMLNPNIENKNILEYNGKLIEYDFSKINIIFATTDSYRMFAPLVNRCMEIYFHIYSESELYKILEGYLPNIKLTCSHKSIAEACRGRARDAFMLATNIKRYCTMKNVKVLNKARWQELADIFDIYPTGLNHQEIKLLRVLAKHSPSSCHDIAIKLGVNERNVESELEIRPKELGFIIGTSRGRTLSKEGYAYLKKYNI